MSARKSQEEELAILRAMKEAGCEPASPNAGTFPDPNQAGRKWWVVSTCLNPPWLMLECENTGAQGVVKDPTREEWNAAFHAPSNPYIWPNPERVTLMSKEPK